MAPAYLTWLIDPSVGGLNVGTSGSRCSAMVVAYLLLFILTLTFVPGLFISLVLHSGYFYPFGGRGRVRAAKGWPPQVCSGLLRDVLKALVSPRTTPLLRAKIVITNTITRDLGPVKTTTPTLIFP